MSRLSRKCIGITLGDPAGIGAEVAAKAIAQSKIRRFARLLIIGDDVLFRRYFPVRYKDCTFMDMGGLVPGQFKMGYPCKMTATASLCYLQRAVELLRKREIDGLVTAPVCKEAIAQVEPSFQGHTEFFARALGVKDVGMMFVSENLRVILATRHIPLNEVSAAARPSVVYQAIRLAHDALKKYFHLSHPVIAVCGLNPHAGEGGIMGKEEIRNIIPAIQKARQNHIRAEGPFAADTLFSPQTTRRYDAVVAMYHDQGLIPIKTLYFTKLVNLTVGLPFVRTSPAHGTAFDIAGKNKANASSMAEAIQLAARLTGEQA
jgi:4-hydroxythreonine-4-phosphate dehydrogenase